MATQNLTERTSAARMSDASADVFLVATSYLDGIVAILAGHKRSKHARAAMAVAIAAAGAISRASVLLEGASTGDVLKPEAAKALQLLDEASGGLTALEATIKADEDFGTQPEKAAFETSDPLDSAARLAGRCRAEIRRLRRQTAAAIRALPEPFKVAA